MGEGLSNRQLAISELVRRQYGITTVELQDRWAVYELAERPMDFYRVAYHELGLEGHESVLDIGCSNCSGLIDFRQLYGHTGSLIGLDIGDILTGGQKKEIDSRDIKFKVGDVRDLPFEDSSLDAVLALFVLYHVGEEKETEEEQAEEIQKALDEIKRVVKPDGKVAIATSGNGNKARHREFEREIANYLGIQAPRIFATPFDKDTAEAKLRHEFEIVKIVPQKDEIIIKSIDGGIGEERPSNQVSHYKIYSRSLLTMKTAFNPFPSYKSWREAIEAKVRPVIEKQIQETGSFRDPIERYLFICKNKK
jgi:SAM-dependent methyltransferase